MLRNFVTATVRITRSSRQKVEATVRQGSFSESDDSTSDEESSEEEEGSAVGMRNRGGMIGRGFRNTARSLGPWWPRDEEGGRVCSAG